MNAGGIIVAMKIEVIRANEQHIPELGDLWMEFMRFSQNIEAIHEPKDDAIPVYIAEYLRPVMEAENSLVLVALDGDRVVGYSYSLIVGPFNLVKREKYGIIHDMFITPQYRGMGVAKMLFNEIIKWFNSNGVNRVELDVMTRNPMATTFWEKLGFRDLNRTLYRQI
jgi:GNAT superfamily N-acetyltransferase